MTAPPFAYYGGKTTLAPVIAGLLPEHQHYVEPFAGSLAVLLAKEPARLETVNDLDHRVMTFWRVLREQPAELARRCYLTPHSRAEHQASYDINGLDELEVARRVWVSITQGRGNTLRRTGWRHFQDPSRRGRMGMPQYLEAYVGRMEKAVDRLRHVSLECRDGLEVIREYGQHEQVCIYADPPYLGSVRSSRQYVVEMSQDAEHEALAEALKECRAAVVLSGYHSPMYDVLYAGWHVHELKGFTGQANTNGARIEVLWSNRPFSAQSRFTFDEEVG
jgi:DNA adenine methylase